MKKALSLTLAAIAAITLISGVALAGGGSSTLSTNSIPVLGPAGIRAATAWQASTAYTVGERVKAGHMYFMCVTAGTSSTTSPHQLATYTRDVTDGTVTWRHVLKTGREGLFLSNEDASIRVTIWFSPVAAGDGITLDAGTKVIFTGDDTPQGTVYAIADSGTPVLSVREW